MTFRELRVSHHFSTIRQHNPYLFVAALIILISFFPICISTLPPVVDYPNHLARIWILGNLPVNSALRSMYEARWWQTSTNSAVDFIAVNALGFVSLGIVSKILLGLMFSFPVIAAFLLNKKIFGSSSKFWPIFIIISWNSTAIAGFMSFQISIGMAIFMILLSVRTKTRAITIIEDTFKSGMLYIIHPFGWIFYTSLRFGEIIGMDRPNLDPTYLKSVVKKSVYLTAAVIVPVIMIALLSSITPTNQSVRHLDIVWWSGSTSETIYHIFSLALSPLVSYSPTLDLITGISLASLLLWQLTTGNINVHWGLISVSVLLLLIGFLAPSIIGEGSLLQFRFPVMAYFTAAVAISSRDHQFGHNKIFYRPLILIAFIRMSVVLYATIQNNKDIDQLERISRYIEPGSSVLVTNDSDHSKNRGIGTFVFGMISSPSLKHTASLLVPWRGSFIPTLFRVSGQHAIGFTKEYDAKGARVSDIPTTYQLEAAAREDKDILRVAPYLKGWPENFKYVLTFDQNPSASRFLDSRYAKIKSYTNIALYRSKEM